MASSQLIQYCTILGTIPKWPHFHKATHQGFSITVFNPYTDRIPQIGETWTVSKVGSTYQIANKVHKI